jgi:Druantia protein DruA
MVLLEFFQGKPTRAGLQRLLADARGREAIGRIVRQAKASRVGTAIADLTVCGAVPPYNEILGGKLVAALMAGPEVVQEYRRRYGETPSVIASSMVGRAVVRPAELVFIGTTSLYGQRPSQYDRISVPLGMSPFAPRKGGGRSDGPHSFKERPFAERKATMGRKATLAWKYLGRTLGMGTFQFGDQTVAKLKILLAQSKGGQRVNSIFGEGVNPRLRKIRDGLNELGLPADELLNHGAPRLVYGLPLVRNLQEYLLGMERRPRFLVDQRRGRRVTEEIIDWWRQRWVGRVERDEVLERMAAERLVHPVRHGARVRLPRDGGQLELFGEESVG